MNKLENPSQCPKNCSCSEGDRIFVHDGKRLRAIRALNADVIWTHDLLLEPKQSSYVHCLPRSNDVYVSYGENSECMRAVDKHSGFLSWNFASDGPIYAFLADRQNIYLSRHSGLESRLIALHQDSGDWHWERKLGQVYHSFDEEGRLYLQSNHAISRLSAANGEELWTYTASGHFLAMESRRGSYVFLREDRLFSRIDVDSGSILWAFELPPTSANLSVYVSVTKSAKVFLQCSDLESKNLSIRSIDLYTGQVRWEHRSSIHPSPYLVEDAAGRIFLVSGSHLTSIDENSGLERWTYLHSENAPEEALFHLEGRGDRLFLTFGASGWRYPPLGVLSLDARTGEKRWKTSRT